MTPAERFNEVLRYTKTNVKTLSERLGYARPQGLYDVAAGRTKNISQDLARKIVTAFPEISQAWLISGEGEMILAKPPRAERDEEPLVLTGAAKQLVMNLSSALNQQEANIAKLTEMVDRLTAGEGSMKKDNAG